jgi:hypothetical protein
MAAARLKPTARQAAALLFQRVTAAEQRRLNQEAYRERRLNAALRAALQKLSTGQQCTGETYPQAVDKS